MLIFSPPRFLADWRFLGEAVARPLMHPPCLMADGGTLFFLKGLGGAACCI